ncbi:MULTISPECIES: hypothetical protein [Chromobacterium]|uniref:Uncharacterized protein n=1 Tax=Chromobacterium haemolyticum TaxID=394935 RepID=A0ABS3GLD8_9NEIS|nr:MULTISPECIES: hypothetical protein [Chromobacterium]MBK0414507.1 hypothetical protein [Chromobacterium haemolyticum]MBO0415859.1 hypothetical protein [Chromobacterium haemolyticum]MBO0499119.1 hypothetical protein [Chromobacterium haemolyticum]QOD83771.1 hypothetical protein IEZ30_04585 [Chromobacterium haemolyticum]
MDIEISNPIKMQFDLQEFDDHLPSLKFTVGLISSKFGFDLNVKTGVWIECQNFDNFVKDLGAGRRASLVDIENNFMLEIDSNSRHLDWSLKKNGLDGGEVMISGRELLTIDACSVIYNSFFNYPKWW